jgi:hypothetical protein
MSRGTVEMEYEFRLGIPKLLLDLSGHQIESGCDLLLISAREPDAGALLDFCCKGQRALGLIHGKYSSKNVVLVFHVAGSSETERKRVSKACPPVVS